MRVCGLGLPGVQLARRSSSVGVLKADFRGGRLELTGAGAIVSPLPPVV